MSDSVWIILIALLVGSSCALSGSFLVLRKLSMMGDAISHTVLFGLAAAFILTASTSPLVMFAGAVIAGLLTTFFTSLLNHYGRLREDASLGVVFTVLFALGVILVSSYLSHTHIDQECVLFGEITFAPLDRVMLYGKDLGPRSFWILAATTLANLVFVVLSRRVMTMIAFDSSYAESVGIRLHRWHYLQMALLSITVVASFEAVGAILVVALLVVPAATALLCARSVVQLLLYSNILAGIGAIGGFSLAQATQASISASIALVSGGCLFAVVLVQQIKKRVQLRVSSATT